MIFLGSLRMPRRRIFAARLTATRFGDVWRAPFRRAFKMRRLAELVCGSAAKFKTFTISAFSGAAKFKARRSRPCGSAWPGILIKFARLAALAREVEFYYFSAHDLALKKLRFWRDL